MEISFTLIAWEEYLHWQVTDKRTLKKIHTLLKDVARNPYTGIGKPEQLKGELVGYYSRRIDDKNRLVYKVDDERVRIFQCGTHYRDK